MLVITLTLLSYKTIISVSKFKPSTMIISQEKKLAHQIMTPITIVKGCLDILKENGRNISPDQYSSIMDTLDQGFGRLESQVRQFLLEEVDNKASVKGILKEVLEDLSQSLKAKNMSIEIKSSNQDLKLPEAKIYNAFLNVISNSVKYSPSGTKINITSEVEGSKYTFLCEDFGLGLSKGEEDHIFDYNYRGKLSKKFSGHGVGLGVVKEMVTDLGGRVVCIPKERGVIIGFLIGE